jgi:hypothetical protein
MATDETVLLEALFYHIVLPPKLPGSFDGYNNALRLSFGKILNTSRLFHDISDAKM